MVVARGFGIFSIEKTLDPLLELALIRRKYRTLFLGTRFYRLEGPPSERIGAFRKRIRTTAERENNANLMVCYWLAVDPAKGEKLLESIPLTEQNVELFSESREQYRKAVDLLLAKGRLAEAASACAWHGDHARRARILGKAWQFEDAARVFLYDRAYENALRCDQKADDLAGVARIHEKMGRYDKALDLWTRLGRQREINRVRAKMGPGVQETLKFK